MRIGNIIGNIHSFFRGKEATYEKGELLGFTRLQQAASRGLMGDVRKFVEEGADINKINWRGHTALDDAEYGKYDNIAKYLISMGAKRAKDLR